jgi:hypothetical protein
MSVSILFLTLPLFRLHLSYFSTFHVALLYLLYGTTALEEL